MPFGRSSHVSESDLSALLDGELRVDAKARCDAHVEACGGCRSALDELRAVRSSLRALPRARAQRSFAVQASHIAPARTSLLLRVMPLVSGATLVTAIAFVALLALDLSGGRSNDSTRQTAVLAPQASFGSADHGGADTASGAQDTPERSAENSSGTPLPGGDVPAPATANNSEQFGSATSQALDRNAASPGSTPEPGALAFQPTHVPTPAAARVNTAKDAGSDTGLHIAEAAVAAFALAGVGLTVVSRCRRG